MDDGVDRSMSEVDLLIAVSDAADAGSTSEAELLLTLGDAEDDGPTNEADLMLSLSDAGEAEPAQETEVMLSVADTPDVEPTPAELLLTVVDARDLRPTPRQVAPDGGRRLRSVAGIDLSETRCALCGQRLWSGPNDISGDFTVTVTERGVVHRVCATDGAESEPLRQVDRLGRGF